jgi:hypothetical protein
MVDNYLKVSTWTVASLPADLARSSIRVGGAISEGLLCALRDVRQRLSSESPQANTSVQTHSIRSWVFPFWIPRVDRCCYQRIE